MDRFQPISITNSSIGAHLYPSEEVYVLTSNVGLYSGPYKSLPHASGTVYLTSHRLFYIDDALPHSNSCHLPLELIKETQYYAGFLKSSAKVTLGFQKPTAEEESESRKFASNGDVDQRRKTVDTANGGNPGDWRVGAGVPEDGADEIGQKTWVCRICAYSNTIQTQNISKDTTIKCQLCGVTSDMKDLVMVDSKAKLPKLKSNGSSAIPNTASKEGVSCPACTFTNHPSISRCEMCDTPLGTINPSQLRIAANAKLREDGSANTSRAQTPVERGEEVERHDNVRLSFRKGGDKAFYSTLKTTLKEKRWHNVSNGEGSQMHSRYRFSSVHRNVDGRSAASALMQDGTEELSSVKRVGIEGIFSAVDLQAREESDDMRDAFRDLEALMMRAKKMVDLAETLNAKLTRQEAAAAKGQSGNNDEAANIIRSSLVRLGLPTPAITLDMAKDEMEYNMQLALELAGLLYTGSSPILGKGKVTRKAIEEEEDTRIFSVDQGVQIGRGIIPLDELWCMWNRARGVALISPQKLLSICEILPKITIPPVSYKTFQSGLCVLHTTKYELSRFSQRILQYLKEDENKSLLENPSRNITALQVATREDCALHLISELLQEAERELGTIARDDYGQGSWFENQITRFDWDNWAGEREKYKREKV